MIFYVFIVVIFCVVFYGKKIEMENYKKWYGVKFDMIEVMKRYFN